MYSMKIRPKVDKMFDDLRTRIDETIAESSSVKEAAGKIAQLVGSETASRSKTILSDMLFDLNDELMKTSFFSDVAKQNKFREINLRQEILGKYQFTSSPTVDFEEASQVVRSLKIAGSTALTVGVVGVGVILIQGLSVTSLAAPIPIGILVFATLGAVLVDYLAVSPNRSKKGFSEAVKNYLTEVQQQLLNWFDEVERYFNNRAEEIMHSM